MRGSQGDRAEDPTFSRLVLTHAPTPILVIAADGTIVFANRAASEFGGRTVDELVGTNLVDLVHPDDREWVVETYAEIVGARDAAYLDEPSVWAPVHLHFADPDGNAVPIRVTGHGGIEDPHVAGVICDLHEAHGDEILGRVLRGITSGVPIPELLAMVMEMVVAPPLGLEAAVLASDDAGRLRVMTSSSTALRSALAIDGEAPWTQPVDDPVYLPVDRLPAPLATTFAAAGFVDLWHVAVESVLGASTYRIIVASAIHRQRSNGIVDLIRRAEELAGVVLVRSQSDEMLRHAALHDPLTRLPNRSGFSDGISGVRDRCQDVAVLYVDLDGFKAINDRYGHAAGDRVLEVVADRLRSATRPDDLVARVGGDEFVVVLGADPARSPGEQGIRTAERIVQLVGESIDLGGDTLVGVAASIGVSVVTGDLDFDDMLATADAAMYEAKRAGGNRYVFVP